jgi:hypothetical protein
MVPVPQPLAASFPTGFSRARFFFRFFFVFFQFHFFAFVFFRFFFRFDFLVCDEAEKTRLWRRRGRGKGRLRHHCRDQAEGEDEEGCPAAEHPPKDRPFAASA